MFCLLYTVYFEAVVAKIKTKQENPKAVGSNTKYSLVHTRYIPN